MSEIIVETKDRVTRIEITRPEKKTEKPIPPLALAVLAVTICILVLSGCLPQVTRFAGSNADDGALSRFEHVKFVAIYDELSLPGLAKGRSDRVWQARLLAYDQAWEPIRAAFPNATVTIRGRVGLASGKDEAAVHVSVRSGKASANPIIWSCVLTLLTVGIVPCYGSITDPIEYELTLLSSAAETPGQKNRYDSTARSFGGWLMAAVFLELDEVYMLSSDLPESLEIFEKRMVAIRDLNRRFLQDAAPLLIRYDRLLAEQAGAKATR
jgi:hypothetical protein